jgi:DNA-binding beta-propeller fold protein YncE
MGMRRFSLGLCGLCVCLASCGENVVFDDENQWDDPSDWPGIGEGKIMATNSGDDTLSFLDPVTLEPVYRAPTGRIPAEREGPHHGAASLDGQHYYVGISNFVPGSGSGPHGSHGNGTIDGYMLKYEVEGNRRVAEVRVDRSPGDVRATPNGKYIVQSHFDLQSIFDAVQAGEDPSAVLSRLAVIDADTMERVAMISVCPAGHGVAIAADSSEVYVACWGSDELAVVSLQEPITNDATVERFAVGAGGGSPTAPVFGPYAVTLDPMTGEAWVSNLEGRSMVVFDPATKQFDDTRAIAAPGSPLFGTFTADGSRLFVPIQNLDGLMVVDPATGSNETLFFTREQCFLPHGVIVLPDTGKAGLVCEGDHFGANPDNGSVARLSIGGGGLPVFEAGFELGVYPDDLVYLPPEN